MKGTSSCANHNNFNVIIFPLCVKFEWNYISDKELLDYVITLLNLLSGAQGKIIVFFICDVKAQTFKIWEQNMMTKERTLRKKFMYQEP